MIRHGRHKPETSIRARGRDPDRAVRGGARRADGPEEQLRRLAGVVPVVPEAEVGHPRVRVLKARGREVVQQRRLQAVGGEEPAVIPPPVLVAEVEDGVELLDARQAPVVMAGQTQARARAERLEPGHALVLPLLPHQAGVEIGHGAVAVVDETPPSGVAERVAAPSPHGAHASGAPAAVGDAAAEPEEDPPGELRLHGVGDGRPEELGAALGEIPGIHGGIATAVVDDRTQLVLVREPPVVATAVLPRVEAPDVVAASLLPGVLVAGVVHVSGTRRLDLPDEAGVLVAHHPVAVVPGCRGRHRPPIPVQLRVREGMGGETAVLAVQAVPRGRRDHLPVLVVAARLARVGQSEQLRQRSSAPGAPPLRRPDRGTAMPAW